MSQKIIGKLTKAFYRNCLLTGTFEDDRGKRYEIINAKGSVGQQLVGNKRLVFFQKDPENPEQDYLEKTCLSIKLKNTNPCTWMLEGSDFENQEDTYIFLKDNTNI